MEEFFKGLVERARYYEQFESFRVPQVPENVRNVQSLNPRKISNAEFLKVSP